jgi:hypothetical protein
MSDYSGITTLNLGNTFGAWYAKTNELITRLNTLQVGSITAGDGMIVSKHPSIAGGYTLSISNTINKNVTFAGNVEIQGTLTYAYGGEGTISAISVSVPYNSGVTVGNVVYVDNTGLAQKAIANDECAAEVLGIVVGFTGSSAQVAVSGRISGSSIVENFLGITGATLQKGTVYFLSAGVSGAGTTLEPSPIANVSKPVLLGITGNSGVILPYRGFMGATSSGSSTTYSGLCGGYEGPIITSMNDVDGYLHSTLTDFNENVRRKTGDVVTVQTLRAELNRGDGVLSGTFYDELLAKFSYEIPEDVLVNTKIYSGKNPWRTSTSYQSLNQLTTLTLQIPKENIKQYTLFSTSGVTTDIWRLKNIKVHVQDAPERSFSFSLIRVINRLGNTNYISNTSSGTTGVEVGPGKLGLRFGVGEITAINTDTTITGSAASITSLTLLQPTTNLPFKRLFDGVTYSGDGSTGGNLFPTPSNWTTFSNSTQTLDSNISAAGQNATPGSGKYPIIYGKNLHNPSCPECVSGAISTLSNRNYTWNFVTHTVGNTGDQKLVSEVIKSSMEGTSIDFSGTLSGVTMSTSILGWNAYYGAVSEALYIHLYDTEITKSVSGIGTVSASDNKKTGTIFLEMSKLDINTMTESGTVIIPVPFNRDVFEISYVGKELNAQNRLYPPGTA